MAKKVFRNIGLLVSERFHRNTQWYAPLVIYLSAMLFGCAPWVFYWITSVKKGEVELSWRSIARSLTKSPNRMFLTLWICVPLVIFSAVKSRLVLYILPLMAPASIATARAITVTFDKDDVGKKLVRAGIASTALILAIRLALVIYPAGLVDMKDLHSAVVRAADGRDYELSLYQENALWGLQFYENRHVERIGDAEAERVDKTLESKRAEMLVSRDELFVFVVRPSRR